MAGDWIKMRNNLWDDPRVSQLCDLTGAPEAMVIGGLYWLWASADEHTEDGHMPGLSPAGIDRKTGVKGLGASLVAVGWIVDTPGGVTLSRFDEHNGKSAKRRCMDAQRKANDRNVSACDADIERIDVGQKTDECGAREEKRREEEKTDTAARPARPDPAEGFDDFWSLYPNRKAKQDAFKAWSKLKPDAELQVSILKAVAEQSQGEDWRKEGGRFVPHAATWLNGKRWLDEGRSSEPQLALVGDV